MTAHPPLTSSALRLARFALLAHRAPSFDALPPEFDSDFAAAAEAFEADLVGETQGYTTATVLRAAAQAVVDAHSDRELSETDLLRRKLRDEEERNAALQSRCYDGFPTISDGIFDAFKYARRATVLLRELVESLDDPYRFYPVRKTAREFLAQHPEET